MEAGGGMTETITSAFREVALQSPTGVTFLSEAGAETVSYSDLFARARGIGQVVQGRNAAPGDIAVIMLPQGMDLITCFAGCICAGMIPSILPLPSAKQDANLYWRDIQDLLRRIDASVVITTSEHAAILEPLLRTGKTRTITDISLADVPVPTGEWILPEPQSVAFLQHSSGTTALKKGVAITHAAAVAQIRGYSQVLRLAPDDCIVSWLPLYHDMGLIACLLLPLMTGTRLVFMDPFEWVAEPHRLLEVVEQYRASLAWLPNFAFRHIESTFPQDLRFDLSSLRALVNCSEPCKQDVMESFQHRFVSDGLPECAIQICYAMAETVFAVTQTPLGRPIKTVSVRDALFTIGEKVEMDGGTLNIVSCGPPLEGVELRILDAANKELGPGCLGQIAIRAPFLFDCYFRLPDLTQATFHDGWYLTGDLGFIHEGELFVTGRLKDVLIIHGKNLMAHDIELALNDIAGIKPGRCVALGVYDAESGSENIHIVAEWAEPLCDEKRIKADIRRKISSIFGVHAGKVHLVPPGWVIKSSSGKINRKENHNKLRELINGGVVG